MKGCFYLQRRFAYIGHALAVRLHEQHGMTSFCGMTSLRSSEAFLRSQKEVPLTQLLVEEDVYAAAEDEKLDLTYLEKLERAIGIPNLWSYIMADRVVRSGQLLRAYPYDRSPYTHEQMLCIVQSCAKSISKFLDEEKPDFVLFSIAGNIASLLLYHLAKQRGIRTLMIDCARIGTGYFLSDTYAQGDPAQASPFVWNTWQRLQKQPLSMEDAKRVADAVKWLSDYRKKPTYYLDASTSKETFSRVMDPHVLGALAPNHVIRSIAWTVRDVVAYYRDSHREDYVRIHPLWNLWDKCVRYARLTRGYRDLFEEPVAGESYAYFALHSEPEAYPMVLAPFYTDQVWLAKQIARSLPVGMKLYVKDHPAMLGTRTREYYRELRKIPNVRLLDPHHSGLKMATASHLTLTLTGTAAWEAALLGRPAVIFGNMFYEPLSGVRVCQNIAELPQLIRDHLETFQDRPEELASFIAAVNAESVDVDLVHLWDVKAGRDAVENRKRLAPLADRVAEIVKRS